MAAWTWGAFCAWASDAMQVRHVKSTTVRLAQRADRRNEVMMSVRSARIGEGVYSTLDLMIRLDFTEQPWLGRIAKLVCSMGHAHAFFWDDIPCDDD
jgi:hypothetical protein